MHFSNLFLEFHIKEKSSLIQCIVGDFVYKEKSFYTVLKYSNLCKQ